MRAREAVAHGDQVLERNGVQWLTGQPLEQHPSLIGTGHREDDHAVEAPGALEKILRSRRCCPQRRIQFPTSGL